MDLTRLNNECNRLSKDNFSSNDDMMKFDDLVTQLQCETFKEYDEVAKLCIALGCSKVYDIGCATGYQSEMFIQNNIEYVGVEGYFTGQGYWNEDKFEYIEKVYPFPIEAKSSDIAISHLCIGWNCFKFEPETWELQAISLARDFKQILIHCQKEFLEVVKPYFNTVEVYNFNQSNWYLLTN